MDKKKAASDIIRQMCILAPFEGWTTSSLAQAAANAGYRRTDAIRVFSGGAIEAVDFFFHEYDQKLSETLSRYHLDTMKIRERITLAVRERIQLHEPHREALRRAVAMQSLPFYATHALKNLYATVDAIWYAVGDNSTDFNFYSKRLTLAAVYATTLLFWLDDQSAGSEKTWAFLDRRIADVMQIESAKQKFRRWKESFSKVA